jgi:hypothetical protein
MGSLRIEKWAVSFPPKELIIVVIQIKGIEPMPCSKPPVVPRVITDLYQKSYGPIKYFAMV